MSNQIERTLKFPINAVTGKWKSGQIHMSGNPCQFKRSMQHHLV